MHSLYLTSSRVSIFSAPMPSVSSFRWDFLPARHSFVGPAKNIERTQSSSASTSAEGSHPIVREDPAYNNRGCSSPLESVNNGGQLPYCIVPPIMGSVLLWFGMVRQNREYIIPLYRQTLRRYDTQ